MIQWYLDKWNHKITFYVWLLSLSILFSRFVIVLLPGKSHGWRSLEGCSLWGCWGSDTTGWLHFHFSLSCIGEGNGNPLQCSCLENPRDGGAWWAAVYGVSQSQTQLKRLSSSSSSSVYIWQTFLTVASLFMHSTLPSFLSSVLLFFPPPSSPPSYIQD